MYLWLSSSLEVRRHFRKTQMKIWFFAQIALTLHPLSALGRWQDEEFPVMPLVEMYNNLTNQKQWQI